MAGVFITVYAFDTRTNPSDNLAVLRLAVDDAKRLARTSPTMGSEVKSYREGTVALVLFPTEALSPITWLAALLRMGDYGRTMGSWGFSFEICEENSGDEIGSGRLKDVPFFTSLVLGNEI